jgi:hypothetical protein
VNGDGYADAIVGASGYSSDQGRAYVFHSGGSGGIGIGNAASASSIITGEEGRFGCAVALGDVTGDGYADAAVGADGYGSGQGRVYVFHSGGSGGIVIGSAALASSIITGESGSFGCSVALGDVTGDGYADLMTGSEAYSANQGRAYVFHSAGSSGIGASVAAASANRILIGEGSDNRFGCSVALGDVTGDGYSDAAVGADGYGANQGGVYVYHSSGSSGIPASYARRVTGEASSYFGCAVTIVDINGNGYADVMVGAERAFSDAGRAYVFHSSGSSGIPASPNRTITGEAGSYFGGAVGR